MPFSRKQRSAPPKLIAITNASLFDFVVQFINCQKCKMYDKRKCQMNGITTYFRGFYEHTTIRLESSNIIHFTQL